jgi:hypothetical protein
VKTIESPTLTGSGIIPYDNWTDSTTVGLQNVSDYGTAVRMHLTPRNSHGIFTFFVTQSNPTLPATDLSDVVLRQKSNYTAIRNGRGIASSPVAFCNDQKAVAGSGHARLERKFSLSTFFQRHWIIRIRVRASVD